MRWVRVAAELWLLLASGSLRVAMGPSCRWSFAAADAQAQMDQTCPRQRSACSGFDGFVCAASVGSRRVGSDALPRSPARLWAATVSVGRTLNRHPRPLNYAETAGKL